MTRGVAGSVGGWAARGAHAGTRRRGLLLALGVSGAVSTALWSACPIAPPAIPETAAGRAFHAWFDAYNAADSARLEAYVRAYDPGMSVHTQLEFRAQTGPYALASVERSDPRHLEVTLRTRTESTVGLTPLTMYGVADLADAPMPGGPPLGTPDGHRRRATITVTLLGTGSWAPVLRIGAAERAVAVESVAAKVGRNYVLPDVARRVADSLRARQARGTYDVATQIDFARRLDGDLRALGGDDQLGVEYAWRLPLPLPPPTPVPPAMLHCGFEPARVLADGVGYVRFYGFDAPGMECSHRVSEAMHAVAGAHALIVDLRESEGGAPPSAAYLTSYLVAGCTHWGDLWDRRTGRTEALWTHDGLPGPAFGGARPLVLLTSTRTVGAAEALAYALRRLGRATVVGETTAGVAHVAAVGPVGEHLLVRVPVAQAVDPVTHTNWQRAGVAPDVRVPASEALATAQRLIREGRIVRASPTASADARRLRASGVAIAAGERATPLEPLRGVRFVVDALGPDAALPGVLSRVTGVVEFAAGRGRFDVTAVRKAPAVAVNGVAVAEPLAGPGDYYLFDNAGFVLVRPAARTFSRFAFARADYNHTGALLPGAFMFGRFGATGRTDTLAASDASARRQHAPVSFHWHMQPPNGGPLYARGWLELQDAPAVEAGVARWFEVAAALATRPGGVGPMARGGLAVTSVALLRRPGTRAYAVTYVEELAPRRVAAANVDPARLVLPAGYRETRWPGFEHAPDVPAPSPRVGVRWHTLEDESSQRARAACGQAWLPEPHGGTW